ncbi:Oidioi.mRNA.OKI2018_I69.chr2.g7547.t1.cds [Oikopleura dioica]|uniref:Oidioi.mRNA.OKI2018_I69.chr2.g7547.t1.cds n=1 Tax=Oikopleura dioica TaxID=34765 RepID=A0ABN7TDC0_OIKDI|nr:Oidioi.mRNA.OKI2018_I69.chr2.g7547.t1.cds [Oikopleura dioica]
MALRDEIASLQSQIKTLESLTTSNKTVSTPGNHPLSPSGPEEPTIKPEDVEKLEDEVKSSQKAIKDLEGIVKRLRAENEDLIKKKKALGEAEKKLLEITATAEKRKKLLDEMATEKFELNQELTQVKEKISAEAEGKLKSQKSEADQNILQLKKDLKEQIAQRKQGEMRILDANRRIDELMSEVKKLEGDLKSAKEAKRYLDRIYEEEKSSKEEIEASRQSLSQQVLDLRSQLESENALHIAELEKIKEDKVNEKIEAANQWKELEAQFTKTIDELKGNIEEEVEKQRIVERKAAVTVRELKKQVKSEKNRADKLQEKLRDIDASQISVQERLSVPNLAPPHRDETSSIGSWSVPTEFEGVTILTGNEADALMNKNKSLMETNLQLEEQVRALEKNQIQMSEELASREEILRSRVWQTRPDAEKQKQPAGLSDIFLNKIVEFASENSTNSPSEQSVGQLKALNKKLLRMLEEEMTKNVAMRKNIEQLSIQLQQT